MRRTRSMFADAIGGLLSGTLLWLILPGSAGMPGVPGGVSGGVSGGMPGADAQHGAGDARTQETIPAESIRAEDLLPLEERTRQFLIVDGEPFGEVLPLALRPAQDHEDGEWVLEFSDLNTLYLQKDREGNIVMVRLDLPDEDHAVHYDPPVRLLPAEIRPHVHIDETSSARVYSIRTGRLERTGKVSHKVLFASRSRFASDAGTWDGFLIPVEHEIDLGSVEVRLNLAGGYVPGTGIVYRRMEYTREGGPFGLFRETKRRTAVLAEQP